MFQVIFKIWWMVAVLPFIIFLEGNKMFSNFLKKKNIYSHWDIWHSFILALIVLVIALWSQGYR